ncbi:MAG TPA: T9SS type A sorting domain-containing protein [Ignavibacteriales bacterium]|nr:T9SS type A sorting domain-containing protein [Ignavibacteriales bacterium]
MKKTTFVLIAILFQLISTVVFSQDSLHYVTSFHGTSFADGLWKSSGVGDVNGDGLSDFIVQYGKHTELYYGSKNLKDLKPAQVFYCEDIAPIGDVNGDGFSDIMTREKDTVNPGYPNLPNIFRIYYGGKDSDTIPKFSYKFPNYFKHPYTMGRNIGDVNGDGYGDYIICSVDDWDNGTGRIFVFLGGKILSATPALQIDLPVDSLKHMGYLFGKEIIGVGDVNNDKYQDFLVSGSFNPGSSGMAFLYFGGHTLSDKPGKILTDPLGISGFTRAIRNAGDLNKDGRNDFIITDFAYNHVYFSPDSVVSFSHTGNNDDVASGGDINGDGYFDFIIGNGEYINKAGVMVGKAFGYYGGSVIDTMESFSLEGTNKWFYYSYNMSIVGDINGDGCAEVLIHEPLWPDYNDYKCSGRAILYSYKKLTDAVEEKNFSPEEFSLLQNYPNPFNPSTTISYNMPYSGHVELKVYDMLGKEVMNVFSGEKPAGIHKTNINAASLPSGIYVCRIRVVSEKASFEKSIKMTLLK